MKRPKAGRGVMYHRDSGGKHEMTPHRYVSWAQDVAKELAAISHNSSTSGEIGGREWISAASVVRFRRGEP
jgi:hypothetical protein